MAARKVPDQFGEPDFEPAFAPDFDPDDIVLLVPDDDGFVVGDYDVPGYEGTGYGSAGYGGTSRGGAAHGGGDGPRRSSRLADREYLAGTTDQRPGLTLTLATAGDRLRLASRRHPWLTGTAAACAVTLGLVAAVIATRPTPSMFRARVSTGRYEILGTDRVISTLTIANTSPGPLTLDSVAIGGPGGQNIGLGQSAVNVPIPPGGTGQVTIRGTLDCRADQPALPAQAQLTGHDTQGKSRTVAATLPGSATFSANVDTYRRNICQVPYPLGVTSIRYGGTLPAGDFPGYVAAMRLFVSVATVPGMNPTAVRYTTVVADVPGLRAMMVGPQDDVMVSPGKPGTIDVVWTVDDCSHVPPYVGIPALSVMGVDARATQMWDYALGDRFSSDLMAGVRAACAQGR